MNRNALHEQATGLKLNLKRFCLQNDAWIYYAVVSVPANILSYEDEPLGPSMKGPLMHRTVQLTGDQSNQQWLAGYFLLK